MNKLLMKNIFIENLLIYLFNLKLKNINKLYLKSLNPWIYIISNPYTFFPIYIFLN